MDVPTNWLITFCVIRVKPKSNHTGNRFSESIISAPLHFTHILIFNWHICRISPSCVYPKWNQWVKMCRPVDEIVTRARRVVWCTYLYLPTRLTRRNAISKHFPDFEINEKNKNSIFYRTGKFFFPDPSNHVGPCVGYCWRVLEVLYEGFRFTEHSPRSNVSAVIIVEEVIKLTIVFVAIWIKRRKSRFHIGDFQIILEGHCGSDAAAPASDTARDWRTENLNRAT